MNKTKITRGGGLIIILLMLQIQAGLGDTLGHGSPLGEADPQQWINNIPALLKLTSTDNKSQSPQLQLPEEGLPIPSPTAKRHSQVFSPSSNIFPSPPFSTNLPRQQEPHRFTSDNNHHEPQLSPAGNGPTHLPPITNPSPTSPTRLGKLVLPDSGLDLELLQTVLADPILTQAVDPFVLQSVLVMANPQIASALDKMINNTNSAGKIKSHLTELQMIKPPSQLSKQPQIKESLRNSDTPTEHFPNAPKVSDNLSTPKPECGRKGSSQCRDATGVDPDLLQSILADPILLRAVDPQVLQAVLVNAAKADMLQHMVIRGSIFNRNEDTGKATIGNKETKQQPRVTQEKNPFPRVLNNPPREPQAPIRQTTSTRPIITETIISVKPIKIETFPEIQLQELVKSNAMPEKENAEPLIQHSLLEEVDLQTSVQKNNNQNSTLIPEVRQLPPRPQQQQLPQIFHIDQPPPSQLPSHHLGVQSQNLIFKQPLDEHPGNHQILQQPTQHGPVIHQLQPIQHVPPIQQQLQLQPIQHGPPIDQQFQPQPIQHGPPIHQHLQPQPIQHGPLIQQQFQPQPIKHGPLIQQQFQPHSIQHGPPIHQQLQQQPIQHGPPIQLQNQPIQIQHGPLIQQQLQQQPIQHGPLIEQQLQQQPIQHGPLIQQQFQQQPIQHGPLINQQLPLQPIQHGPLIQQQLQTQPIQHEPQIQQVFQQQLFSQQPIQHGSLIQEFHPKPLQHEPSVPQILAPQPIFQAKFERLTSNRTSIHFLEEDVENSQKLDKLEQQSKPQESPFESEQLHFHQQVVKNRQPKSKELHESTHNQFEPDDLINKPVKIVPEEQQKSQELRQKARQPKHHELTHLVGPPSVCSLVTGTGIPCGPGLATNPATGSCEWPDTLIEAGCNPEVVTGFGPCPQDVHSPILTQQQVSSWPNPRFPVNLDVVTIHHLDAESAKKYFIVCIPSEYGKLFPRLVGCPNHEYFDPLHVEGCVKHGYHSTLAPHIHHHDHPPEPLYQPHTPPPPPHHPPEPHYEVPTTPPPHVHHHPPELIYEAPTTPPPHIHHHPPEPLYQSPTYHETYHHSPTHPPTYGDPEPILHHIGSPISVLPPPHLQQQHQDPTPLPIQHLLAGTGHQFSPNFGSLNRKRELTEEDFMENNKGETNKLSSEEPIMEMKVMEDQSGQTNGHANGPESNEEMKNLEAGSENARNP